MASRSVNKVILVGNLGRDSETKYTPSGDARTTFSIATGARWKDQQTGEWKEKTDWHNIVVWRQQNLANYLTKGKQVYVEGRLETRSYDDRDGNKRYVTEVVARDVILLGGRGEVAEEEAAAPAPEQPVSESSPAQPEQPKPEPSPAQPEQPKPEPSPFDTGVTDDDVPF